MTYFYDDPRKKYIYNKSNPYSKKNITNNSCQKINMGITYSKRTLKFEKAYKTECNNNNNNDQLSKKKPSRKVISASSSHVAPLIFFSDDCNINNVNINNKNNENNVCDLKRSSCNHQPFDASLTFPRSCLKRFTRNSSFLLNSNLFNSTNNDGSINNNDLINNNESKNNKWYSTISSPPQFYLIPKKFNGFEDLSSRKYLPFPNIPNIPTLKKTVSQEFDVQNLFPNNDDEIDRLHSQHYLYRHIWGNNFSAPIEEVLKVKGSRALEIGCGPGTFIFEMSHQFEKAKFTGIDKIPMFPTEIKPQNSHFVVGDILKKLPFEDSTFDYVCIRLIGFRFLFTEEDWNNKIIKELIRITKPGGWVEFMVKDLKLYNEGPKTTYFRNFAAELLYKHHDFKIPEIPKLLDQTNQFTPVQMDEKNVPIGSWGGNNGKFHLDLIKWEIKNLRKYLEFALELECKGETYEDLNEKFLEEVEAEGRKVYTRCLRYWTMKKFPN
ncbi:hypothetical protein Glove_41g104 [Diversispora epigaea]|uniref:Methyltransferase domain-containing protein n=1 Tax=Diversispora epigaea TaxID=1348612 RepID=A0A397JJI9_9GLOM|nr:hypothetical protein Glove_41g104 [Diversispora epigaea]